MSPSLSEEGKPKIFLLRDPQREKDQAKKYTNSKEAIAEYADIVDILYQVVEKKELPLSALNILKERFASRFKLVADVAGTRLVQLSHYFPDVQRALLELIDDKRHQIRLRVVQSIWTDYPPKEVTDEILRKALTDKSAVVRQFAVSRIGSEGFNHLQEYVVNILAEERNEKVLAEGHYALQQLNKPKG